MKPSSRPTGIALISAFLVFAGLLSLMLAALGRVLALDLATGLRPAALVALLALNGLLCLLTAWGLWRLRPWARLLAIACALLGVAPSLLWFVRWLRAAGPAVPVATIVARLAGFVLWAVILGYLSLPHVRQAFRHSCKTFPAL